MPVEERLMAAGQWNFALDPDTPKSIRDTIDYFGHCYVFDASRVRPGLGNAAMLALSRWGGIVRKRPTPWEVGGVNMIAWLGDEDGKGPVIEAAIAGPATLLGYLNALLTNTPAVTAGTIFPAAGGATPTMSYNVMTSRAMLDHLCLIFTQEYRVNKDATLEVGPTATLFPTGTTPTAAAIRRNSGRDLSIAGISVTHLDVSTDAEDYVTRIDLHNAAGTYNNVSGSATPYKDLYGNPINMTKIVESAETPAAQGAAAATSLVAAQQVLHQQVALATDEFDIDRDVRAGDWIWVYDEDGSLKDTTNQVRYRGSFIYPLKLRVMAITWPIEQGMSVWYRSGAGVWTDLTTYVNFEPPGAVFEVGAPIRPLTIS